MIKIIVFFIMLLTINGYCAQERKTEYITIDDEAELSDENKTLVDSLLKISFFEEQFIIYCNSKIDNAGLVNKWSEKEILKRKSEVNFIKFKNNGGLYNSYSQLSSDEIKIIITSLNRLNENHTQFSNNFIFIDFHVMNNLASFVKTQYLY